MAPKDKFRIGHEVDQGLLRRLAEKANQKAPGELVIVGKGGKLESTAEALAQQSVSAEEGLKAGTATTAYLTDVSMGSESFPVDGKKTGVELGSDAIHPAEQHLPNAGKSLGWTEGTPESRMEALAEVLGNRAWLNQVKEMEGGGLTYELSSGESLGLAAARIIQVAGADPLGRSASISIGAMFVEAQKQPEGEGVHATVTVKGKRYEVSDFDSHFIDVPRAKEGEEATALATAKELSAASGWRVRLTRPDGARSFVDSGVTTRLGRFGRLERADYEPTAEASASDIQARCRKLGEERQSELEDGTRSLFLHLGELTFGLGRHPGESPLEYVAEATPTGDELKALQQASRRTGLKILLKTPGATEPQLVDEQGLSRSLRESLLRRNQTWAEGLKESLNEVTYTPRGHDTFATEADRMMTAAQSDPLGRPITLKWHDMTFAVERVTGSQTGKLSLQVTVQGTTYKVESIHPAAGGSFVLSELSATDNANVALAMARRLSLQSGQQVLLPGPNGLNRWFAGDVVEEVISGQAGKVVYDPDPGSSPETVRSGIRALRESYYRNLDQTFVKLGSHTFRVDPGPGGGLLYAPERGTSDVAEAAQVLRDAALDSWLPVSVVMRNGQRLTVEPPQ